MSSGLLLALSESMGREIASRLAEKLTPPPLPPALVVAMAEYHASLTSQVFEHHLLGAPLDEEKRRRPDDEFDTVLKQQARSMCEPGGLIGDILRVGLGPPISQQDQLDALGRLVRGPFSRSHLFHPGRWSGILERAFAQQGWGDRYQANWRFLVGPALQRVARQLEAIAFDNLYMELYPHLRRETRKGVERALLDGETFDEYVGRSVAQMPEPPEGLALEAEQAERFEVLIDTRIDVIRALPRLSESQRDAMLMDWAGWDVAEAATKLGIRKDTFRKRRQRARVKLREFT